MSDKAIDLFSKVKGQERAVSFLQTALENNRLPQTLLFVGPSGVGRKLTALATLQVLVCEKTSAKKTVACGVCGPCIRVAKRESESLIELAPQGATTKIEQIRTILRELNLQNSAKARAVIVEDAELMTAQSSNALLKTLEEPPKNTWFFLIAPSVSSVLSTIRSRSQIVQFNALSSSALNEISSHLNLKSEPWQVEAARGRIDNLQALQSEEIAEIRKVAFEFWQGSEVNDSLSRVSAATTSRENSLWVVRFWQELLRDSFYFQLGLNPIIHQDYMALIERVAGYSQPDLERLSQLTVELEKNIQANFDYSLAIENFARNEVYAE